MFKEARDLFKYPKVERDFTKLDSFIKWNKPEEDKLREFLVTQKGFSEIKVESGLKKLKTSTGKQNQARIDNFFCSKMQGLPLPKHEK